jgi:signal transduction histidine kinase
VHSLKVSAHVLVQLGSELVTDVEQALLECVKNAYDADAPGCKIEIDTREIGEIKETSTAGALRRFAAPAESVAVAMYDANGNRLDGSGAHQRLAPDAIVERHLHYTGRVTIEDSGTGLSPEKIAGSWLVISGSSKRSETFGPKTKTFKGRTPLGDKGLGRLGSMKLGDILIVESAVSTDAPLASARFRWSDCIGAATVDEVPVFTEVRPNSEKFKGTRVKVLGLKDMPEWRRKDRIFEISKSLARLVSPFEVTSTFPVVIQLDGAEQSLESVTNQVLDQAVAKFTFDWKRTEDDKSILVARAAFKKRLFTASRSEKQREKTDLVFGSDDGQAYLDSISSFSRTKGYRRLPAEKDWFLVLEREYSWTDMLLDNGTVIADPGPFKGAFYFFNLDLRDRPDESAVTGFSVEAKLIKDMAGISLLRDGFRVRSSGDWLGIAAGMTSGSFYHMRDNNTIGFFQLTGEHNFRLVEKSDREGFVEDAAYRGFFQVAATCRDFANDALENTRRAVDALYKERLKQGTSNAVAGAPFEVVEKTLQETRRVQERAQSASAKLSAALDEVEQSVQRTGVTDVTRSAALAIAREAVTSMEVLNSQLALRPDGLAALRRAEADKDDLSERSIALFESAAVGLSARGLAHELRTHITEVRQKVTAILQLIKQGRASEEGVAGHIRTIRAACTAIASAAALIDPMLPRARNLRDTFAIRAFVEDYVQGRKLLFEREQINVSVIGDGATVRINKARLLQALDNLIRNSIYWMRRSDLIGNLKRPKEIRVELSKGGFSVADSGPGVDTRLEDAIFELFVTGKPAQDPGQGLGLFIIRQLLEADGCEVSLTSDRNPEGRRFRFNVDLSSVVVR